MCFLKEINVFLDTLPNVVSQERERKEQFDHRHSPSFSLMSVM